MSCKKLERQLVDFVDGELSGPERERVEDHLSRCPHCREMAEQMGRGMELYKAVGRARPVPELSDSLALRVSARMIEKKHYRRPLRARLALAAGAFALFVGVFVGYSMRPYLPGTGPDGIELGSIRFTSRSMGVEIEGDNFILHSKDLKGNKGIDLKF